MEYGASNLRISLSEARLEKVDTRQNRGGKRRRNSMVSGEAKEAVSEVKFNKSRSGPHTSAQKNSSTTYKRRNTVSVPLEPENTALIFPGSNPSRKMLRDWDKPGLMDRLLSRHSSPDPPSSPLDEVELSDLLSKTRNSTPTASLPSNSPESFRLTTPAQFDDISDGSPSPPHSQSIPSTIDTPDFYSHSHSHHSRSQIASCYSTEPVDCSHPDETPTSCASNRRMSLPDAHIPSDSSSFTFRMPPPPPFTLGDVAVEMLCPKPNRRLQKTVSDSAVGMSSPRLIRIAKPKPSATKDPVVTSPAKTKQRRKTAQPRSQKTKTSDGESKPATSSRPRTQSSRSFTSGLDGSASPNDSSLTFLSFDEPIAQPQIDVRNILSDELKAKFDLMHAQMKQEAEASWENYEMGAPFAPLAVKEEQMS
ncbi:hypothetical protein VNI00_014575 [Paramarasmius palmivorus]|uniref:Uncharacterized protein n=1 Tax=Paramarasmius palmivorus TaxID=297713 RepID=A0AAW0BRY6_9AGAR